MDNNNCEVKFEKITTGNGFQNDLIATANNRVELAVVEICKLKDTISKFEKTIVDLDDKNERLQKKVLWLTIITVIFTATQIIQVIDILIKWFK